MGTDLNVCNAARVSFHKESEWEVSSNAKFPGDEQVHVLADKDKKLINYLAKHNHWSPFAHVFLSFRIKAPIFVARQLAKHQVGLSWNEVSRRYVDEEPEFYFPDVWRGKPVNAKQGSTGTVDKIWWIPNDSWYSVGLGVEEITQYTLRRYLRMIEEGVAPEQARMVLPQNTQTEWIWSGSLMAFARVVKLRTDLHAQLETQEVAHKIAALVPDIMKHSWEALVGVQA